MSFVWQWMEKPKRENFAFNDELQFQFMTSVLLHTEALQIGYKSKSIATGLELSLMSGKLVCLLGPNGAGKSTLMRTIAGLQPTLSGHLQVGDIRSPFSAAFLASQIAVVLSEFEGVGGMKVKELVELGRAPYSGWSGKLSPEDKIKVETALAQTDVSNLAARSIGTLSDGERQRVMIARALAQETPLILLDEPTSHLDISHRVKVMRLLHNLTRTEGKGILLSSHDLDLALQGADEIWLLSDDGNMTIGTPEDLLLSGQIAQAYGSGSEEYDWKEGGLRLLPPGNHPIQLIMDAPTKLWVRRALAKIDWREGTSNETSQQLTRTETGWEVLLEERKEVLGSLGEVLGELGEEGKQYNNLPL